MTKLFEKSDFLLLKKSDFSLSDIPNEIISFPDSKKASTFHEDRKYEFHLARFAIDQLYFKNTQTHLLNLKSYEDRSIHWPNGFVGSISHNADYVFVALGSVEKVNYLGIDIEKIGRIKESLLKAITNEDDLMESNEIDNDVLHALIFSAKESLYKALYPDVKKYFGFDAAAVIAINPNRNELIIKLRRDLSDKILMADFSHVRVKYSLMNQSVMTAIEI